MKKLLLSGITILSIISCKQKETQSISEVKSNVAKTEKKSVSKEDITELTFENYKVNIKNNVKKAKIDFTSNPDAKNYRTSIKEEYSNSEINFAGNYIVTTTGCGQACISGYIVDTRDGKVYDLPDTEDDNSWEGIGNGIEHKPTSTLLITKMDYSEGTDNEYHIYEDKKFWLWNENDKKFELIKYLPNHKTLTEKEWEKWYDSQNKEN